MGPPFSQFKDLAIFSEVANCTAQYRRPVGFMEVFFDDVFVNTSAAP